MGYFSNGSEGGDYEHYHCNQCVHQNGPDGETPCVVWMAHLLCNYDECNKPESILHMLIPRLKDGMGNGKCKMFHPADSPDDANCPPVGATEKKI
jgi:hypothetical protein